MKHEIDTGDILLAAEIKIEEDDNVGNLNDKMMHIGAEVLFKTVSARNHLAVAADMLSSTSITSLTAFAES